MIAPEASNNTWTFEPRGRRNTPFDAWVGDQITFRFRLKLPDGTPANAQNSRFVFRITDNTLGSILYQADWDSYEVTPVEYETEGLIEIVVPTTTTDKWREGIYAGALMLAREDLTDERTLYNLFLRLRYTPASPHRNIPYRGPLNLPIVANVGATI